MDTDDTRWDAPLPEAPYATEAVRLAARESLVSVGVAEERARALVNWLAEAPAESLLALRPDTLPREVAGDDPLDILLAATEVSVLTFTLLAICGWCGAAARRLAALCEARPTFTCVACSLEQSTRLDVSLEAVFTPTRTFRRVDVGDRAGPLFRVQYFHPGARAPDGRPYRELLPERVAWVGRVPVSGAVEIAVAGADGDTLEVIALPSGDAHTVILDSGCASPSAAWIGPGERRALPGGSRPFTSATMQRAQPGVLELQVGGGGAALCALWIRRQGVGLQPATVSGLCPARALYLHPRARARLPSLLLPSEPLAVQDVTVWFSDVSGSASLYEAVGDVEAWRRVEAHFEVLRSTVVRHGGAVLKTLGDAVLAAFGDPTEAALAAADALRSVSDLTLRIGLARGPALAVDSNGLPDLFGRVLNVASRLQILAEPGGLCVEASALGDDCVAEAFPGWTHREGEVHLKGIDRPVRVGWLLRA